MREDNMKDIHKRLTKLEKSHQHKIRFVIQVILSPILVVVIGFILNSRLEEEKTRIEAKKTKIQQFELAQDMLPHLFSEDEYIGFATQRLMERVLEDQELKDEIAKVVREYYAKKIKDSIAVNDPETAQKVVDAAQSVGGGAAQKVIEQVEQDQTTKQELSKYQKAVQKEREGFNNLIAGDYPEAIAAFEAAEEAYNGFHQVYEIARVLRSADLDNPEERNRVFRKIIEEYSWKAPEDALNKLEELIQ